MLGNATAIAMNQPPVSTHANHANVHNMNPAIPLNLPAGGILKSRNVSPRIIVPTANAPQMTGMSGPMDSIAICNEDLAMLGLFNKSVNPMPYVRVHNKEGQISGLNVSPLADFVSRLRYFFICRLYHVFSYMEVKVRIELTSFGLQPNDFAICPQDHEPGRKYSLGTTYPGGEYRIRTGNASVQAKYDTISSIPQVFNC
jgi:hypothetical protein